MKHLSLVFLLFLSNFSSAQESNLDAVVGELKEKIRSAHSIEKLQLMDSLSLLVEFNDRYNYDSLVRQTIKHALVLDSLDIATRYTGDLIYYKSSILGKSEEGLRIFEAFAGKEKGLENNKTIANLYLYGGDCFLGLKKNDEAIATFEKAKKYALASGDKNRIATITLRLAYAFSEKGLFSKASITNQEAGRIFTEIGDTINMVNAKNALSILYSQNAFYKQAEMERNEAIALCKNLGGGPLVAIYYNAAADKRMEGNYEERIRYLKLSLDENEKSDYRRAMRPNILTNLVIAYAESDSLALAEEYLSEIERNGVTYTEGDNRDFYIEALKQLAFAKKDFPNALKYGKEHLAAKRSEDGFVEIYNAEKFLADVYKSMGDRNNSNAHLIEYYRIRDSISSVQNVKSLTYYQTLYETEKRDATIKSQIDDIALLDAKAKLQNQLLLFGGLGLLGVFGLVLLVRSRNSARQRVKMQEVFSQDLIQAQEEERTRVARELHDGVGQKLMMLTRKTRSFGDPEVGSLADNTLEELRNISRGLHPANLERLGLTKAIEAMINEVDANTNIFFTNEIENIDGLLKKEDSLHLYRIVQEVLNNLVKHADAKSASVTIEKKDGKIEALIQDNGRGFVFSEKIKNTTSLGMKTLLERAKILKSKLEITGAVTNGTTVSLSIPI